MDAVIAPADLLPSRYSLIDKVQSWLVTTLSLSLYHTTMMLSRTLPSLSRSISTAVAGSSRSRSSLGLPIVHRARVPVPIVQALRSGRTYSTPAAPAAMDEGEKAIYEKLSAKFPGNRLEVQDVSGTSFTTILRKSESRLEIIADLGS